MPGMSKAAGAASALGKFLDDLKLYLHNRHENHLRNPRTRLDDEGIITAVPARYEHLTLVVRVDQPDEIAQHDTVLVPKARPRQENCSQ